MRINAQTTMENTALRTAVATAHRYHELVA